MKKQLMLLSGLLMSGYVLAQNPLSVHVLNLENGLPSQKVMVTLEEQKNGKWVKISEGLTDEQGRISALYPEGKKLEKNTYKVTFKTGDWYKKNKQDSFFPEVPVIFNVDGKLSHYHIPLLMSPYGYSTYRGS